MNKNSKTKLEKLTKVRNKKHSNLIVITPTFQINNNIIEQISNQYEVIFNIKRKDEQKFKNQIKEVNKSKK
jgi:hypothetical protein